MKTINIGFVNSIFAFLFSGQGEKKNTKNIILEAEFLSVVEKFEPLIKKLCLAYSSSQTEFEDLMQDTMLNLWRGFPAFRGESKISTWIYKVCLNTCVASFKKLSRNPICMPENIPDKEYEDNLEDLEMITLLYYGLSKLNPMDRAIIMLWLDEKSYEEISEIIGYPRNTVASRIRRIKEKLAVFIRPMAN